MSTGLYQYLLMSFVPGVVVIDDRPEVTIHDPAFLYESNEGFQEVTSKKEKKLKHKVVEDNTTAGKKACATAVCISL